MKKIFTRVLALMLLFAVVMSFGVHDSASAASYPYVHLDRDYLDKDYYVGDIVAINYAYSPAYKNEKLQFDIYDSSNTLVYTVTRTYYNSSIGFKNDVVSWNSKGATPGTYSVVVTKYFYSLYNWNEAPTQTTGSFKLQDASLKPHWVQESNGKWRYKKGNSYVKNSWQEIDGKWYHFDSEGYMQTGWVKSGSSWYYFASNGVMQTGWKQISGKWYYFNSSGAMQTGWQQISGKWYYFDSSGAMKTGWVKSGSSWYYFDSSGAMVTGWKKISGSWYYFNSSGAMQTGWQQISGKWYYFNSSGVMQTGWLHYNSKWYYFDSDGAMLANTSRTIGSKEYHFDSSGVCTNP